MKCVILLLMMINCRSVDAKKIFLKNEEMMWKESFGGDVVVSEFQSIANGILRTLLRNDQKIFSLDQFKKTINEAAISCESNLSIDGVKKDAINYPYEKPQRILLDCVSWDTNTDYINKIRLVVHEYLHLMFVDDFNYFYSSEIMNRLVQSHEGVASDETIKNAQDAIFDCNEEKLFHLVDFGLNLFQKDQDYLGLAIIAGCPNLVKMLTDLKIPLRDIDLSKRSDIKTAPLVLLFTSLVVRGDVRISDPDIILALKKSYLRDKQILELILKMYPSMANPRSLITLTESLDSFIREKYELEEKCREGANLLHYLASGKKGPAGIDGGEKIPLELILDLMQLFNAESSLDGCRRTVKEILKENGI